MDLLSLPDEMLNTVFKYMEFDDLKQIRKKSSKVDDVSRKYRLNLVKVNKMKIQADTLCGYMRIYPSHTENNIKFDISIKTSDDLLHLLQYYVPRIRSLRSFLLYPALEKTALVFTNEMAKVLLKSKWRRMHDFWIGNIQMMLDPLDLTRLLTKFKSDRMAVSLKLRNDVNYDACLSAIEPRRLCLEFEKGESDMSISFVALYDMIMRKIPTNMTIQKSNAKFTELCEMFEKLGNAELWLPSITFWFIGLNRNTNMNAQDAAQYLKQLECFQTCRIAWQCSTNSIQIATRSNWMTRITINFE